MRDGTMPQAAHRDLLDRWREFLLAVLAQLDGPFEALVAGVLADHQLPPACGQGGAAYLRSLTEAALAQGVVLAATVQLDLIVEALAEQAAAQPQAPQPLDN